MMRAAQMSDNAQPLKPNDKEYTVDEALSAIGMGVFQYRILVVFHRICNVFISLRF